MLRTGSALPESWPVLRVGDRSGATVSGGAPSQITNNSKSRTLCASTLSIANGSIAGGRMLKSSSSSLRLHFDYAQWVPLSAGAYGLFVVLLVGCACIPGGLRLWSTSSLPFGLRHSRQHFLRQRRISAPVPALCAHLVCPCFWRVPESNNVTPIFCLPKRWVLTMAAIWARQFCLTGEYPAPVFMLST